MHESKSQTAWQGRSWRLCVSKRTLADGTLSESAYIDHPGSVVIIPWRESALGPEVLMLKQYREALSDTILELPAGTRGQDEALLDCAQRELREETGYRAGELHNMGQCWPAPGVSNEIMTIYLATGLEPDPLPPDNDEEIEVAPYNFDELLGMALDGRLHDAKSIVGLLRTALFLGISPFSK